MEHPKWYEDEIPDPQGGQDKLGIDDTQEVPRSQDPPAMALRQAMADAHAPYFSTYEHYVGKSEIPRSYHYWASIGTVAASLAKRIYIKRGHSPIYPNLYVFLLGPSGNGKNAAIDIAFRLFRVPAFTQSVNPHRIASFTAMGILDLLGQKQDRRDETDDARTARPLYMVTPELSESLGDKHMSSTTIKHMTDWYSGEDYPLTDIKRQAGKTVLKGHCFNWAAGSTEEWLMESIPESAMKGGFLPRVVAVLEKADYRTRIMFPNLPGNLPEIQYYLRKWLKLFTLVGNRERDPDTPQEVKLTPEALAALEEWYMTRENPPHKDLHPIWKRQPDLVLKLAMIYSVADPREWDFLDMSYWQETDRVVPEEFEYTMTVREHHIQQGIEDSDVTLENAPTLLDLVFANAQAPSLLAVADWLRRKKTVTRTQLSRQFATRLTVKQLDAIIESLRDQGKITVLKEGIGPKMTTYYKWVALAPKKFS